MKNKKHLIPFFIALAISLAVGAGIFCLFYFLKGENIKPLIRASDGAVYAAVILVCSAGMIYVCRCGFFDFVSYGFRQLGSQLFMKDPNKYNDYPTYREEKRVSRVGRSKYYLGILLAGGLFLIAGIICLILLK